LFQRGFVRISGDFDGAARFAHDLNDQGDFVGHQCRFVQHWPALLMD
jgi:hypothetical protein